MKKNTFLKYFISTLKEAKFLIIKYVIVGLYLIVSGVVTNRLNLNNLTYYNAIITLSFFAEMIGFGFIEGFGIYINQNIQDKEKSKNYAKIGFYWTIIFSLLFIILLACFPNFIIKDVLSIDFKVEYSFYYLMVISIFLSSLLNYILELLKKLTLFKFQLICSSIQCVLILVGMFVLVITGGLYLNYIAIIYIAVYLFCLVIAFALLTKNNVYSVNLFKVKSLRLKKREVWVVICRAFSELVWEVGYFFISLFILKSNVFVYNQYCYFENALDIFNGIIFAFFNVTAIKICRCIGAGKRNGAYNYAINSLKATILLWIIYAIIVMSLFVPLRAGLNVELQSTALISIILFLLLSLIRFVDWNLGTYIIGQSEVYVKLGFILEFIGAIYWIIMYLLSGFIHLNIYLIYLIIALESIFKISVNLYLLKKKKWVNKIK